MQGMAGLVGTISTKNSDRDCRKGYNKVLQQTLSCIVVFVGSRGFLKQGLFKQGLYHPPLVLRAAPDSTSIPQVHQGARPLICV
jgi:hypothetical protein